MKSACSVCCSLRGLIVLTSASIVLLVGVLVLSFYGIPRIIEEKVGDSVRLTKNTDQWDRFIDLPIPIVTKVYFYHVLNADEVVSDGAIPKVQEIGPYVYNQRIKKENLSTNKTEDSVSYTRHVEQEFDPVASGNLSEDDYITVVNAPYLVLAQITSNIEHLVIPGCLKKIFSEGYFNLFINTTVKSLIFEGYYFANKTSDLGYACSVIRDQVIKKTKVMKNIERIMSDEDPTEVQMLKFSFLGFKIEGPDGVYTVNRGIDDIKQLGNIMKWNHSPYTKFWGTKESTNNDTCKRVRGGDSMLYPPRVSKSSSLEIFSTDICRTVEIFYTKEDTYKDIIGYRFEPKAHTFYPETMDIAEDCYCIERTLDVNGDKNCYLDGVMDMYDCFGVPLLLSFPHFLYAPKYLNMVENLEEPDEKRHGTYLLIEPNTGIPLQGRKRVQFNMVLRPITYMPFTDKLPKTILPVVWVDEGADLTNDLINMLNSQFFDIVKIANGFKYALIAVTAAFVLVSGGILFRKTVLK